MSGRNLLRTALSQFAQALAMAAMVATAVSEARSQNFGGNVTPNAGGGSSVGTNAGATVGSGVANGPSINYRIGSGMNGVSANGIWPYGVAPNATESNNAFTARPAPPVPNPAVVANSNRNVHPNLDFNAGANMTGSRPANFGANQNLINRNGAWMYYYPLRGAYGGAGTQNGASQTFGQSSGYAGRTFARGNPNYFGIQRSYANGRNSLGYGW